MSKPVVTIDITIADGRKEHMERDSSIVLMTHKKEERTEVDITATSPIEIVNNIVSMLEYICENAQDGTILVQTALKAFVNYKIKQTAN